MPLHDVAMRFQTAVGDYRATILAFDHGCGIFESLVGIASYLFAGSLGAGTYFTQVLLLHHVWQYFVVNFNSANRIFCNFLAHGADNRHFGASPLEFRSRRGNDTNRCHAFHRFSGGDIDALHFGMSMGAMQKDAEQLFGLIQIGRVFGAPASFLRSIEAVEGFPHHRALVHWWPTIFRHCAYSLKLPEQPLSCQRRYRSGRCCRSSPSVLARVSGWDSYRGTP